MDSSGSKGKKKGPFSPNLVSRKLRRSSNPVVKLERDDIVPIAELGDSGSSKTREGVCYLEPKKEVEATPSPRLSRLSEKYAPAAEVVRKKMFSSIESADGSDEQFMNELADAGFQALGALDADPRDLIDRAKELIRHKVCLGKAEKEIKKKGCSKDLVVHRNAISARSLLADKVLEVAKSALAEEKTKALEIRKQLEEIEANAKFLEENVAELEKDYEAVKVEEKGFGEEAEKMKEVERLREQSAAAIWMIMAEFGT